MQVVKLQHADAGKVATVLKEFFGAEGIVIGATQETNMLVIQANKERLKDIFRLVEALDKAAVTDDASSEGR